MNSLWKGAELTLVEREARWHAITDSIDQMIWSTRPDGFHDFFNERWYEFTGAAHGSTDGEAWNNLFHPDDQERAWATWRHCLATGERYHIEYRLRHATGIYRWVLGRAQAKRDESGRIVRWYGTCTDIDDLVKAREVLARSHDEMEQLVAERTQERDNAWKLSRDLQVVIGPDGIIQAANDAWLRILGWRPDEVIGHSQLFFSATDDDQTASQRTFVEAFGALLSPYEHRAIHKDGSSRWVSWVAAPEGDVVFASGRDVTAQHESVVALKEAQEQLRQSQKMEAVGQLTGGLAHDFNNLLMGISGSLELLNRKLSQKRYDDWEKHVDAAQGATKRAASLTHRLLAFSRRQTLEPKPTDVDRLITGMGELIRRTIGPTVNLIMTCACDGRLANVDRSQLENAVLNLCINARDAMPEGGDLRIETRQEQLDHRECVELDVVPGPYLKLCVLDTGCGMTKAVADRAFDPFFTTKPLGMGTGLGLSMVYGFARQSAGQISIASVVGSGTAVSIFLPRYDGPGELDDETPAPTKRFAGIAANLLVVDDDVTIRNMLRETLEADGHVVWAVADGVSALSRLRMEGTIDVLITDVGLPGGLNGRQLADAARAVRPKLKILFITGYAEQAVMGEGDLDEGMHILVKPFRLDVLTARVTHMLQGD